MTTHRFDAMSALLALVAIAAGAAVAFDATDPVGATDVGVWLAAIAFAAGLLLIPWGRRDRSGSPDGEDADAVDG